ncbi:hypothetical protein ACLEPN_42110 [Myxococcus sp. 1LA]
MTSWRAIPVWLSLLCGGTAGGEPLREGEARARIALESQDAVDISTESSEGIAPGLFSQPWAVCSDAAERLRDIRPGPTGSLPMELTRAGSALVFSADDRRAARAVAATDAGGRRRA